ncbi:hypothetical protein B0A48_02077 [Cryoendolithus antarcticus]|uniref:Uncharacterized protein n=1 Tax=Cryoendolithus antarcticus TaxID=1507870 RepID=A0A1V8TML9_9PEZI|nr:hypothetical protein B0A48_02077 [Cryoendolithus antarcticus]
MPFAPLLLASLLFRFRVAIVLIATYARVLTATRFTTDPEYYDRVAILCTIMLLGLASGRFADNMFPPSESESYGHFLECMLIPSQDWRIDIWISSRLEYCMVLYGNCINRSRATEVEAAAEAWFTDMVVLW